MMEMGNELSELLLSALAAAGTVLAAVMTWLKGLQGFQFLRDTRLDLITEALEVGAIIAYDNYTAAIKAGREDGKLTSDERAHARKVAVDAAVEYLKETAPGVLHKVGRHVLDRSVATVARRLKSDDVIK